MIEPKELALPSGTVRYWESGAGRPLVFVHGVLANGALWERLVPLLGGVRCIVPDWPLGAHALPMNADADLTISGLAALIAAFLEALALEDVILVGNDTGGALCQVVATEHPQRLGGVVLTSCDAFDNFLPPLFRYLQRGAHVPGFLWLTAQSMRVPALRRLPLAFGRLGRRLDDTTLARFTRPALGAGTRRDLGKVLRDISPRYTEAAAEKLKDFDRPLLLAWSAEDRLFPIAHAHRLAARAPRAQVVPIDDADTFSALDNPEQLARVILAWLATQAAAR